MSAAQMIVGWAVINAVILAGGFFGVALATQYRELAARRQEQRALDGWARMEDERRARSAARQADERELFEAWQRSERVNLDRDGQ